MEPTPESKLVFSIYPDAVLGYLIEAYLIDVLPNGQFSYNFRKVHYHLLSDHDYPFSENQKQALRYISELNTKNIEIKYKKELKNLTVAKKMAQDEKFKTMVNAYFDSRLNKIFATLKGSFIYIRSKASDHPASEKILIESQPASVVYNFEKHPDGINYFLNVRHQKTIIKLNKITSKILCMSPCWIRIENHIYHFDDSTDGQKLKPFFDKPFIQVPEKMSEKYFETFVLPAFQKFDVVHSGFDVMEEPGEFKSVLSIELGMSGYETLQLYFKYDDFEVKPSDDKHRLVKRKEVKNPFSIICFKRKRAQENIVLELLNSLDLQLDINGVSNKFVKDVDALDQVFEWINTYQEELTQNHITVVSNLTEYNYYTGAHYLEFQGKDSTDWFDVKAVVEFEGFSIPFHKFKRHILEGKRNYELPDGKVFRIPDAWFSQYDDLMRFSEVSGDSLLVDKSKADSWGMLDAIVGEKNFFEELPNLHIQKQSDFEPSENLAANLRPYQLEGFQWLCGMAAKGMGACLADDMGLGKTLQTIAVLQRHHEAVDQKRIEEEKQANTTRKRNKNAVQLGVFSSETQDVLDSEIVPSLIVVTPSILHNWVNELQKFAPNLKVHVHSGNNRYRFAQDLYGFHIVLTSYGTVRNDEWLQKIHFEYLILDESQLIKNPRSASFQAIRKLKCNHRIAMTGTPLENSLIDLWSQLSFLNPGILGSLRFFNDEFVIPIEKEGNEAKMQKVKKLAGRLILRRTKEEVAKDLPPLTEQIHVCEMSQQQGELYEEQKSVYRNLIIENLQKQGRERSNMMILKGLMQLRLIANHPLMFSDEQMVRSGKFEAVMQRLETLKHENRKVLVFSQFVKHLKIYENEFKSRGWDYSMLIGSTTNRSDVVNEFEQHDGFSVFLISLKAGGVGLNLVSADMVFLLDPWWNPAVEAQAISRAHRIGQNKPVHVYRFISRETIEEKIITLQDRKRNLAKSIVVDSSFMASLSDDELRELVD